MLTSLSAHIFWRLWPCIMIFVVLNHWRSFDHIKICFLLLCPGTSASPRPDRPRPSARLSPPGLHLHQHLPHRGLLYLHHWGRCGGPLGGVHQGRRHSRGPPARHDALGRAGRPIPAGLSGNGHPRCPTRRGRPLTGPRHVPRPGAGDVQLDECRAADGAGVPARHADGPAQRPGLDGLGV